MNTNPTSRRLLMIGGLVVAVFGIGFLFTMREEVAPTPLPPTDPVGNAGVELLTPQDTYAVGEEFTLELRVHSTVPANTYAARLKFSADNLTVIDIDDAESVIDLWIEDPHVTSANDSIFIAGGSLRPEGFTGEETLLQVTFRADDTGSSTFSIEDLQILAHDGRGSEIPLTPTAPLTVTITD